MFSTFERALRKARDFAKRTGRPIEVVEVDKDGNETPVATAQPKAAEVLNMRCPTCGNDNPKDWRKCIGAACPISLSPHHVSQTGGSS